MKTPNEHQVSKAPDPVSDDVQPEDSLVEIRSSVHLCALVVVL